MKNNLHNKNFQKTSLWHTGTAIMLSMQMLMFAMLLYLFFGSVYETPIESIINISMSCICLPVLILMMISGMRIKIIDSTVVLFTFLIFSDSVYTYLTAFTLLCEGKQSLSGLVLICNTGISILSIVMFWIFWLFLCAWNDDRSKLAGKITVAADIVAFIGIVFVIGNVFEGYYFDVTGFGYIFHTEAYPASLVCPTALIVLSDIYILLLKIKLSDKLTLISYSLVPWIASVVDVFYDGPDITSIFLFASLVYIYSNIFLKRDEMLAVRQAQLAESKLDSMVLQINPHFIYNTLGTVSSLCGENPQLAQETLYSFSNYLRNNIGELAHKKMIPFKRETEHLDFYISIEKIRFPDIIFEKDYSALDFFIPPLTLQPLVENAITHGIMGRETGGAVKISSYETDNSWVVKIEDNGVGFETLQKNDGRNHIGISNVRSRIEMLCGGDLIINSTKDVGTVVQIRIPKGESLR